MLSDYEKLENEIVHLKCIRNKTKEEKESKKIDIMILRLCIGIPIASTISTVFIYIILGL